jgi:hypothetical protein
MQMTQFDFFDFNREEVNTFWASSQVQNGNSAIGTCARIFGRQADERKTKGEQSMKTKLIICAVAALTLINGTQAQSRAGNAVPVTVDNYNRV